MVSYIYVAIFQPNILGVQKYNFSNVCVDMFQNKKININLSILYFYLKKLHPNSLVLKLFR
jgi:hypothetical protein